MVSMNDYFNELKLYSDTIMENISFVLTKKKIKFTINESQTEISISSKTQSKDSIMKILNTNLKIPKEAIKSLISIMVIDDSLYIRLKTK